jgi:hypothetical protein
MNIFAPGRGGSYLIITSHGLTFQLVYLHLPKVHRYSKILESVIICGGITSGFARSATLALADVSIPSASTAGPCSRRSTNLAATYHGLSSWYGKEFFPVNHAVSQRLSFQSFGELALLLPNADLDLNLVLYGPGVTLLLDQANDKPSCLASQSLCIHTSGSRRLWRGHH